MKIILTSVLDSSAFARKIMNVLDKILLFLSSLLCGNCRKELLKHWRLDFSTNIRFFHTTVITNKYLQAISLSKWVHLFCKICGWSKVSLTTLGTQV